MTIHHELTLPGFWPLLYASFVLGVGLVLGGRVVTRVLDGTPLFRRKRPPGSAPR